MNQVVFEKLASEHECDVMEIFNHYIENSFAAYPENRLPQPFFNRLLEMTQGYPAYAMKLAGKVAGFCFLRPYNPFSTFSHTAEITYFIHPEEKGKGLGKKALGLLEKEAMKKGISIILASISSENHESIAFHAANGFIECGRFAGAGKKFGTFFDVVWMQKRLL